MWIEVKNNVLLVPMQPTPNGRMHIGHAAGTYLRTDVLARALKLRGHSVRTITGSDVFENWVIAEGRRTGFSGDEICDRYHEEIREDLEYLNVTLDAWIDPRSPEHREPYLNVHEETLRRLQQTERAMLVKERIPFSTETDHAVVGTWIAGECPDCRKSCGGSSCVFCGGHFQPEQLLNARSRLDDSVLRWEIRENWFARPNDFDAVIEHLESSGVRADFRGPAVRYLTTHGGRVRLTGQGAWGLKSNLVMDDSILSNGYYLYSVYCGEVYRRIEDRQINPFAPSSDVTTVGIFGSDNSVPGLIAPYAIAQGTEGLLKPFDFTIVNGMLLFEGQKCSTSKRHGIWIGELAAKSTISSDELRFALLEIPLDEGAADVTLDGLIQSINQLRQCRSVQVPAAMRSITGVDILGEHKAAISDAYEAQHLSLMPDCLDLPRASHSLKSWMSQSRYTDPVRWLLGLALLSAPLTPDFAQEIWSSLGLSGKPNPAVVRAGSPSPPIAVRTGMDGTQTEEVGTSDLRPLVHLADDEKS